MGTPYYRHCHLHCCIDTKGGLDQREVVVDGLGDADDRDLESSLLYLFVDIPCTTQRSIPTDGNEDVDIHLHQRINNLPDSLTSASGRAKNRSALLLDVINEIWVEGNDRPRAVLQKTLVAVLHTADPPYPIAIPEASHYRTNDIIQTWTDAATGADRC